MSARAQSAKRGSDELSWQGRIPRRTSTSVGHVHLIAAGVAGRHPRPRPPASQEPEQAEAQATQRQYALGQIAQTESARNPAGRQPNRDVAPPHQCGVTAPSTSSTQILRTSGAGPAALASARSRLGRQSPSEQRPEHSVIALSFANTFNAGASSIEPRGSAARRARIVQEVVEGEALQIDQPYPRQREPRKASMRFGGLAPGTATRHRTRKGRSRTVSRMMAPQRAVAPAAHTRRKESMPPAEEVIHTCSKQAMIYSLRRGHACLLVCASAADASRRSHAGIGAPFSISCSSSTTALS